MAQCISMPNLEASPLKVGWLKIIIYDFNFKLQLCFLDDGSGLAFIAEEKKPKSMPFFKHKKSNEVINTQTSDLSKLKF